MHDIYYHNGILTILKLFFLFASLFVCLLHCVFVLLLPFDW